MSIEWLERCDLGLSAGVLSCRMPEVVRLWLLGVEGLGPVLAYGAAAGILFRELVYAGFYALVMWHIGWHTCRLGGIVRACGDARQNVIFFTPFLVPVPCSHKTKQSQGFGDQMTVLQEKDA